MKNHLNGIDFYQSNNNDIIGNLIWKNGAEGDEWNQHGIALKNSGDNKVAYNIVLRNYGFDLYQNEWSTGNSWIRNIYLTKNW